MFFTRIYKDAPPHFLLMPSILHFTDDEIRRITKAKNRMITREGRIFGTYKDALIAAIDYYLTYNPPLKPWEQAKLKKRTK